MKNKITTLRRLKLDILEEPVIKRITVRRLRR